MKKNRTMRLAALMLVLTLITSCFVGGTFAKYVSKTDGSDVATVAKWSFKVTQEGETEGTEIAISPETTELSFDIFNTVTDDDGVTGEEDDANVANVTGKNIIAPGTGGKFTIAVENQSEVTAKFAVEYAIAENTSNIPLEFSKTGTGGWSTDISTVAQEATEIAMNATANTATVYWRWAFEQADTATGDPVDTALGIAAQTTAPTVTVKATITATQVD